MTDPNRMAIAGEPQAILIDEVMAGYMRGGVPPKLSFKTPEQWIVRMTVTNLGVYFGTSATISDSLLKNVAGIYQDSKIMIAIPLKDIAEISERKSAAFLPSWLYIRTHHNEEHLFQCMYGGLASASVRKKVTAIINDAMVIAEMEPEVSPEETKAVPLPPPPASTPPPASLADELTKLNELRDKGVLTDAEFADQKEKLLNADAPSTT